MNNTIACPVCRGHVSVSQAVGRKSQKPFVMLKCDKDGRHFRAFITDQQYVKKVIDGAAEPMVASSQS